MMLSCCEGPASGRRWCDLGSELRSTRPAWLTLWSAVSARFHPQGPSRQGPRVTVTRTPLPMGKAIPTRAFLLVLALPLTGQSLSPESFFKRIISQVFPLVQDPLPGLAHCPSQGEGVCARASLPRQPIKHRLNALIVWGAQKSFLTRCPHFVYSAWGQPGSGAAGERTQGPRTDEAQVHGAPSGDQLGAETVLGPPWLQGSMHTLNEADRNWPGLSW